jgi:hypothetical protein
MQDMRIIAGALVFSALALSGCGSDQTAAPVTTIPTPTNDVACTTGTVQLAVLQSATVPCGSGNAITLPAGGATYLVVPQFATASAAYQSVPYSISASSAAATARESPSGTATPLQLAASIAGVRRPGAAQRRFSSALRAATARNYASHTWQPSAAMRMAARSPSSLGMSISATPSLGSSRTFSVVSNNDSINPTFKQVSAVLRYVGANILVYVDASSPANGFTAAQLTSFGAMFDQTLYPIDVNAFGPPSDIDGNGHLVMLLSPVVNSLVTKTECQTDGYVAGFFDGYDLASSDPTSNQGEIFYSVVPDPLGTYSCSHTADELDSVLPSVFLHELQHLISFSQHALVHGGNQEDSWIDEGLSLVAEELGSFYYEQKYPAPSGRTSPNQIFPDSAESFIIDLIENSYEYLLQPDTASLTLHDDSQGGIPWRGGDWLLLHWLGDQKGGAAFYRALDQSSLTGVANIEAAAGEKFTNLFGDFSLSLYTDSLPGVSRSAIPSHNRFITRNLRALYQALYNSGGEPRAFPIPTYTLGTSPVTLTLVPGTMAFYKVTTASSASTVTIRFNTPGGGLFSSTLLPQVSIFRLPPGT